MRLIPDSESKLASCLKREILVGALVAILINVKSAYKGKIKKYFNFFFRVGGFFKLVSEKYIFQLNGLKDAGDKNDVFFLT